MNYTKGQSVIVRDFKGRQLKRRVWEDDGRTVSITSDEAFELLESGSRDLWPIGFPKADVSPLGSD